MVAAVISTPKGNPMPYTALIAIDQLWSAAALGLK
jgi:hypothetical protein